MATSGTVARTVVDVISVIEKAVKKCGVLPNVLTSESLEDARMDLFLLLTGLTNKGINLWCVKKAVYATKAYQAQYTLLAGTEDIHTPLLRRGTAVPQTSLAAAVANYAPTSAVKVVSVIVLPTAAGAYSLVLESSPDGVTWTNVGSLVQTLSVVGTLCFDSDPSPTVAFWRVRETVNLVATFTSVQFLSACNEIPMGKLSRDNYTELPDKTIFGEAPLQFWFDKQPVTPVMHVWPVPSLDTMQFVIWYQRQIQDVGVFSNTIDIPQRWLEYVIYALGSRIILEIPKELIDPNRIALLIGLAEQFERIAADSETDGAPIRWTPNISSYTK
jgi:hypothetical protein